MLYGMPYRGSKNSIAEWVVEHLPSAEVLIDLFAGGCAITHCAMLSGKYKRIVCDDILGTPDVFMKAIHGQISMPEFVGREEFFAKKDKDPLIAMVYSFGNNMRSYLYSKELEPYKRALHDMLTEEDPHLRRRKYRAVVKRLFEYCNGRTPDVDSDAFVAADHLARISRIEELSKLSGFENAGGTEIEPYSLDYHDVLIPHNALVYCDPPYKGANGYGKTFDSDAFFDWARAMSGPNLIVVSEYSAPDDFVAVAKKEKVVKSGRTAEGKQNYRDECLFVHKSKLDEYVAMMGDELFPKWKQLP